MDVATWTTNMPFSRGLVNQGVLHRGLSCTLRLFRQFFLNVFLFFFLISFLGPLSFALEEKRPVHFSGDRQLWDRKANRVELFGHANVSQMGETLSADYILLDLNTRVLDAKDNCIYVASDAVIWGEEMHFNLDTRTGTVLGGRVSNDRFTLRGERINKLGPGRFQTHWSNYSTCRDCANSWSIDSEDMDVEVEGYALLSNVTTRVKDAPAFWLPYMVLPLKTKRQTGFIFPKLALSGINGATFVLPFFWATSRSTDMTIALGEYMKKGHRFEWEGRYNLGGRNAGIANFYYLMDREFTLVSNRWALNLAATHDLPYEITTKLKFSEVSDNLYPFHFGNDIPGSSGEVFLRSGLSLSRTSSDVSSYVLIQRNRNLLNSTAGDTAAQITQFDPRTVQAFPSALVTTNDRPLWGSGFVGGLTVGLSRFSRTAGPFDYDDQSVKFGTVPSITDPPPFTPGVDPVRKATRFSVLPSVYTTIRPFDVISVVPSIQYRGYFYNFENTIPGLARGYVLFQTEASTQFEKIYDYPDDPKYPKVKHLIRPMLLYSMIPVIRENKEHPFIAQIDNAQNRGISGYNFDNNDVVPYTYNQSGALYFLPLGHSLAYGFTTQWIRKKEGIGAESPVYQTTVEWSAGQGINFLEISNPNPIDPSYRHIFTRLFSNLVLKFDKLTGNVLYYYNPDIPATSGRNSISTSASYVFERSMHQRIMTYDRSLSFGYSFNQLTSTSYLSSTLNFSLNDYLLPYGSIGYNLVQQRPSGVSIGLQLQSPSQCWKVVSGVSYISGLPGLNWNFDLQFNLTGASYGGITEIASQVASGLGGSIQ